jgi:hypothetical protein
VTPACAHVDRSNKSKPKACQESDPVTGQCRRCSPGLRGPTCSLCATDAGCTALAPDLENPICDQNVTYSKNTHVKAYSCYGENIAGGVVAPGIQMSCNTSSVSNSPPLSLNPDGSGPFIDVANLSRQQPDTPGSDGGTCILQFQVKSDMNKPVMCLAWGCLFEDGFGRTKCLKLKCDCPNPNGCPPVIGAVLPQLTENAMINCDPKTSICKIEMNNLPLLIEVPCVAGECVDPQFNGTASAQNIFKQKKAKSWTFAMSSIPIAVAVLMGLLLLVVTIPRMAAVMRGVAAVKNAGGTIASGSAWSGTTGVTCALSLVASA